MKRGEKWELGKFSLFPPPSVAHIAVTEKIFECGRESRRRRQQRHRLRFSTHGNAQPASSRHPTPTMLAGGALPYGRKRSASPAKMPLLSFVLSIALLVQLLADVQTSSSVQTARGNF
jgi:hypothetical protein